MPGNGTLGVPGAPWNGQVSLQENQGRMVVTSSALMDPCHVPRLLHNTLNTGIIGGVYMIMIKCVCVRRPIVLTNESPPVLSLSLLYILFTSIIPINLARNPFIFMQADFVTKCKVIRDRLESRESETLGKWMTEEQLKKSGSYSPASVRAIVTYCQQFPESLVRPELFHESIHEPSLFYI